MVDPSLTSKFLDYDAALNGFSHPYNGAYEPLHKSLESSVAWNDMADNREKSLEISENMMLEEEVKTKNNIR